MGASFSRADDFRCCSELRANGRPNRHAFHDVGQAVAYATIQAMSLGLWVHQMAGIDLRKIRDTYELPEGYDAVAAIVLGYATTPEHLPESLRHRHDSPRSRKPVASFVFSGRWGKSLEFPVTEADPRDTIGAEGTF